MQEAERAFAAQQMIANGTIKDRAMSMTGASAGVMKYMASLNITSVSEMTFAQRVRASAIALKEQALAWAATPMGMATIAVTSISLLISGFKAWRQNIQETRQELMQLGQQAADTNKQLYDLISQYSKLGKDGQIDLSDQETAKGIQEQIVELVGDQAKNIDLVNGKYDEEIEKLQQIKALGVGDSYNDISRAAKSAEANLRDGYTDEGFDGSAAHTIMCGSYQTKSESEAIKKVMTENGFEDFISETQGVYKFKADMTSPEKMVESYYKAVELASVIARDYGEDIENSEGALYDFYNNLNKFIDNNKEDVEAYSAAIKNLHTMDANADLAEYLKTNDINNQDAFDSYIEGIKNSTEYSDAYKQVLIDVANDAFPQFSNSAKDAGENVNKMTVSVGELEKASDGIKTLGSAFKELSDDGHITTKTLGEIKTATGLADDEWARYESTLLNAKKGSTEFNQAMSDLTYKILENKMGAEKLANATEEQIAAILRENGVLNANAVAESIVIAEKNKKLSQSTELAQAYLYEKIGVEELTKKTEEEIGALLTEANIESTVEQRTYLLAQAKEALRIKTALAKATTAEEVVALAMEASQAGITGNALNDLIIDMGIFNNTNLDVSQKVAALQEMGYYAHWTAQGLANIDKVKKYSFDGKDYIASYDKDGKLVGIEQEKEIDIPKVEVPKITIPNYSGAASGGKSGSDNKPDYEDPTDAIINRINLRSKELEQHEEQIENAREIAELENDYKKQISLTNDLIDTRRKRVEYLNKANAELHNEAEYLRNSNPWDEESWFDSQGNATQAYYDIFNSAKTKEEQEYIKDLFESLSKYKKAYTDNANEIVSLNQEIVKGEKDALNIASDIFDEIDRIVNRHTEELQERADDYDILIDKNQALVDGEEKFYEAQKKIREVQKDITSELNASKKLAEWIDEDTRALLFNENDYDKLSNKLSKLQEDTEDIHLWYQNEISQLTEDNWYLEEAITKEYERRLESKEREYEIARAELDLEKKRSELNNILAEKNVSMVIGGQIQQVADFTKVKEATEEMAELEGELNEIKLNSEQQATLALKQARVDGLNNEKAAIENRIKMINEQTDKMKRTIDDFINPLQNLSEMIELLTGYEIPGLDKDLNNLGKNISSGSGKSSGYSFNLNAGNKVVKVHADGKAPSGLSEGDVVLTGGGAYRINAVNSDGSYVSGQMDTVDYSKKPGYASGTNNASKGLRKVNEFGDETYIAKDGTFHNFAGGEIVFTKEQSERLMSMIQSNYQPIPFNVPTPMQYINTRPIKSDTNYTFSGDIIVQNPRDYDDFLWQMSKHMGNKIKK